MFVSKTSWRRLEDMFWRRLQDMSSRHLKDMSSRRLQDMSSRPLQRNNFSSSKTFFQDVFFKTSLQDVFKMSSRRFQDVLEDEKLLRWKYFEDVFKTRLEDVFKTNKCLLGIVWKSIAIFYYSQKYVKRRFSLGHVTKVSAQTLARGCKKRIQLEKT